LLITQVNYQKYTRQVLQTLYNSNKELHYSHIANPFPIPDFKHVLVQVDDSFLS